ncbi:MULTISPECIES: IclR family transcriptional regulator [Aneurinibacillus]|jgi:DNA-binding IclR family transcriptional regulator|uniref:Glycerol operon regulatory protein n=1 Tax=Aneurinibacillus danicus TaxID=267746 RepID=A0A511VGK5_9BACL|nr:MULTISPECIES: IclR family transcriptional regulator [Aneurinibacillus]GEN36352.1 IclR family transcriptional regulator [Aneurinibacillus danicus]
MPIIQSVERALRILDLFDEYETELKITDISARMNLHKSTVHSLLKTLQKFRYIEQNMENGKYRLGMKLFERGNFVIHNLDIRSVAKNHLTELSMKTGNTIHLVILDGKEGVYIDKVEGSSATVLYSRIGRRIPIHCSAVGKVLVAFKSQTELAAILKGYEYRLNTANTIANEKDFLTELKKVKDQGFALDNEENEPGVACIAVPIRNHTGEVVAAMSMSQPATRLNSQSMEEAVAMLKEAAQEISVKFGYGIHSGQNATPI